MEITTLIGIILALIIVAIELSTFLTYGGFVSKKVEEIYMNLDESQLRLNMYNPKILSTNHYITDVPISLLVKYHIDGFGTVPRWYKLHKKINHYFEVALNNEFN